MRPKAALVASALAVLALAAAGGAAPADDAAGTGVENARLETRNAAEGFAREVRSLLAGRPGPFWIAYAVPARLERTLCCWADAKDGSCGRCLLESDGGHGSYQAERRVALEAAPRARILLRAADGRVARVKVVSENCVLDAGGLPFVWLTGVKPAESVAFLADLAAPASGDSDLHERTDSVLAAIAHTDDPSADAALERFVAAGQPPERRKKAVFWMGVARGGRGYEVLRRLLRDDEGPRFREHVVFALTQSKQPGALDRIVEAAKRDADAGVRGQALFWLAQTAARKAVPALQAALDDDPEVEVKKKAVFAVSQLPRDEGVPMLIRLARTHKSREVRKQAMFWLGQTRDARALAFFEELLTR
jgi:hypothetical protein